MCNYISNYLKLGKLIAVTWCMRKLPTQENVQLVLVLYLPTNMVWPNARKWSGVRGKEYTKTHELAANPWMRPKYKYNRMQRIRARK